MDKFMEKDKKFLKEFDVIRSNIAKSAKQNNVIGVNFGFKEELTEKNIMQALENLYVRFGYLEKGRKIGKLSKISPIRIDDVLLEKASDHVVEKFIKRYLGHSMILEDSVNVISHNATEIYSKIYFSDPDLVSDDVKDYFKGYHAVLDCDKDIAPFSDLTIFQKGLCHIFVDKNIDQLYRPICTTFGAYYGAMLQPLSIKEANSFFYTKLLDDMFTDQVAPFAKVRADMNDPAKDKHRIVETNVRKLVGYTLLPKDLVESRFEEHNGDMVKIAESYPLPLIMVVKRLVDLKLMDFGSELFTEQMVNLENSIRESKRIGLREEYCGIRDTLQYMNEEDKKKYAEANKENEE